MSEVKNVTITVPVGLNGWQQTGSVVINGMKVEFPVGEETQVPETAAALLNELIEAAEKRAEDTAKPNNHYVGAVTIPAGKNLTLEEGAGIKRADKVILPETEVATSDDSECTISESVLLEGGKTYIVTINGMAYDIGRTAKFSPAEGVTCVAGGNLSVVGLEGGNPDCPFTISSAAGFGTAITFADPNIYPDTTIKVSIVEKGEAVSVGGGIFTANVTLGEVRDQPSFELFAQQYNVVSIDKSYDEILAAVQAGKLVRLAAGLGSQKMYLPIVSQEIDVLTFSVYYAGMGVGCIVSRIDGANVHNENTSCEFGIYAPAGM